MLDVLADIDQKLFLFLNGLHNNIFDVLMYWISQKLTWIPLYAFLLYLLWKEKGTQQVWIYLLAIAVLIAASDQISSSLIKPWAQRLRPCHNPDLQALVHLVNNKCGGRYGFISSHAANSFALATFLIFVFGEKYRFAPLYLLTWATLVSYSRIYLGAHYPGDILGGALLGSTLALVFYRLSEKITPRTSART